MCILGVRRLATCVALVIGFAQAASAAEILIGDAKSQPESLTLAPGRRTDRWQRQQPICLQGAFRFLHRREVYRLHCRRPGDIFLWHAVGCLQ